MQMLPIFLNGYTRIQAIVENDPSGVELFYNDGHMSRGHGLFKKQ